MNQHRDLISRATRRAFRELAVEAALKDITGWWDDEGFSPGPEPEVGGERRARYQAYLDVVDWTEPSPVVRALRVFEQTLRWAEPSRIVRIDAIEKLERDGYKVVEPGRIIGSPVVVVREGALVALVDPTAIREHLDRIARAIEHNDPAQAIGSAKELVESTAKLILRERKIAFDDRSDLPELVRQAQVALAVHPSTAAPGPDGSEAVKKILGGAITVTTGITELRNRGYGTGHGSGGRRLGLSERHAHLAVAGAKMWCEFMLDTLADPVAPWRKILDARGP